MKANFIMSCSNVRQIPYSELPEVAFAGRSNVGKSSLMNTILNRKNLVKVGKTPGKTRLLNLFNVGDRMIFTDLPGYGYAVVSKSERQSWANMIGKYFKARQNLVMCLLLVDIRRDLKDYEFDMLELLTAYNIKPCIVLTKSDKLSNNQLINRKAAIAKEIGVSADELIHFSSVTGEGKKRVCQEISDTTLVPWG